MGMGFADFMNVLWWVGVWIESPSPALLGVWGWRWVCACSVLSVLISSARMTFACDKFLIVSV